jgi:DNA-binding PadR family transcriptional regulator
MPRQSSPLSIEYVLLGFIEQEPHHGYDLFKKLNSMESIGMVWRIKQSQLYALLERLEEDGLLTSLIVTGDSRPNRKQYQLTSVGRQTFYAWRDSPVQHGREIRIEFLAKLYFAIKSDLETTLNLIDEQKALCLDWLNDLQLSLGNTTEPQVYERIVFEYRVTQIRAILDWLELTKKEIKSNNKKR